MGWKDRMGGASGRRWLEGANLAVYTAVVVAVVIFANVLVSRYLSRRWDLTSTKKFSLSPQTEKILKGLDRDVTIYDFDREGGARSAHDLLGEYGAASRRLSVRYIDPDREPRLARQFGVRTYGTVAVASGDQHFEAQGSDEEAVTNALIRLLKGQKTVYFVQGHGERDLDSADRSGYQSLRKEFENENYQVKTLVLLQKMEIPADCTALLIAGPKNDYLPAEVETIRKYVQDGGRLLLMLDPGMELPNLGKLLADWNVTIKNDLVIDVNPLAQLFGTQPTMPLILKYGSSPIVQPLARTATMFPFTRSFEVGKEYKSGITDESLCETSADSYGVADFNPKMREVSFRPGKDTKGPLTVAVSGDLTAQGGGGEKKKAEGRFVALGTSTLAANVYLGFQGNRDLVMNTLNWLTAEEDLISIRPKPPANQHLDLNAQQMRRILLLGVFGIPLLIIAAGVSVWWGRR